MPSRFAILLAGPGRWAPSLAGCVAVAALTTCPLAGAQQRGAGISASFSATQQFTDNRDLSASGGEAESITVLTPRVRLNSRSGRVQGSLDYSLSAVLYGSDSGASRLSNALSGSLAAELVDQHLFFDATATISQEFISAFGVQSDRRVAGEPNTTERRTLSLGPSLRGRIFGDVELRASLRSTISDSSRGNTGDTVGHDATVSIGSGGRILGWSVDAGRSISDFDGGRRTTQDRISAQVSYSPDPGLRFFVTGGAERNDVQTVDQRASDTWGAGVSWRPTPRTQFGLQAERRYFGNSHSLNLSHRMRRAVISYSDSRSITERTTGAGVTLSAYELFFIQFASIEPDPVQRDLLVRDFLRAAGVDPDERINAGFVNTALSVQRTRNLSLAMSGRRSSAVLSAFATTSRRADSLSGARDDLSQVDVLRQHGWTVRLSHRLTPVSSIALALADRRTQGRGTVAGNGLRSASLSWSNRIGQQSSLSLTARHTEASGANAYQENALTAAFNTSF